MGDDEAALAFLHEFYALPVAQPATPVVFVILATPELPAPLQASFVTPPPPMIVIICQVIALVLVAGMWGLCRRRPKLFQRSPLRQWNAKYVV